MAKYKKILVSKLEAEKRKEKKQEQLRKESGITNTDIQLTERSWVSYLLDAGHSVVYFVSVILAFIGIIMVLNPESRNILMQIFHLI